MERLVFYGAAIAAVLAALAFFARDQLGSFHYGDFDDFGAPEEVLAVAAEQRPPQTYAAAELDIVHAALRLTIIPEDRADIIVEIDNPGRAPTPEITLQQGVLQLDGRLRGRIENCSTNGAPVRLRGYGEVTAEDLPRVTVRTPRAVVADIGGASVTEIGAASSLDLSVSGCGVTTIADVEGALDLDVAGVGGVSAGAAQSLDLDLAGTAKVRTGAIAAGASLSVTGTGEALLGSLTGALDAESTGVGDIVIEGGAITTADITLAGPGSARIAAPIERLHAELFGPGRVDVDATVGDLDVQIAGPGNIHVRAVTGNQNKEVWGPGAVIIGP